jgi:RNA polymerase sigma-70 factor (ECF subfamily)
MARTASMTREDPTELSDAELVASCLSAGRNFDDAFEGLYRRHSDRVFGFLLKITGNRTAAEDALQETFLRVYKSLDRFDTRRDLTAWLLQIARYVAIDAFRVEKKVKRLEEHTARERTEIVRSSEDAAEVNERKQVVDDVLNALSIDDRSLLLLRHFEGMTFKEIGRLLDCSARTAQNRVEASARRFQLALKNRHSGRREAQ